MGGTLTKEERDLTDLVNVLRRLAEECQRSRAPRDDARHWALGFALKVAHHAISALTLMRERTALTADHEGFLDWTSLCVLARAGWEAFLLFHYLYIQPQSEDERELRWLRWSIESPRSRQHYERLLPGQTEQLAEERTRIEDIEARIRGNAAFLAMTPKKQEEFLREGGRWRPSWRVIGERAGLAKVFREDHYNYLCDHAHTGWFSVALLRREVTADEEAQLRTVIAGTLAVATADVIDGLRQLFPGTRFVGAQDAELVDRWVAAVRSQDVGPQRDETPK